MKKFLLLSVAVFFCLSSSIFAADSDIKMELACPASVTAGSDIITTVTLTNNECTAVKVQRYMSIIAGNSTANTLSNAGVWGPFPKNLPIAVKVPAAQCDSWGYPLTPGVTTGPVLAGTAPAVTSGTMATVMISFITNTGKVRFSGNCMVSIK